MVPWIATICVLSSSLAVGGQGRAEARPSADWSLGTKLAAEFRNRSSESLLRFAQGAIERFLLDEQEFAVDTSVDLADLVAAAVSLDVLLDRKSPGPGTLMLATRAASMVHRLGWRYDNDPVMRRRIAQIGADEGKSSPSSGSRSFRATIASFRQVGGKWFWKLLPDAKRLHPQDPVLWNLEGLALKQRGDLEQAQAAFQKALTIRSRPVFALNLYDVALRRGLPGTPELKRQLVARIPALEAALSRLDAREQDRKKTRDFERGPLTKEPIALLEQAERYLRLGKQPLGDALVREALADPQLPREQASRAVLYWMESGRDGRAVELIEKRGDRLDSAWEPMRLTLAIRTRLDALSSPHLSVTPEVQKNWRHLNGGLQRLRRKGGSAALQADVVELFLAVREVNAAKADKDLTEEARSRAKLARLRRILKEQHGTRELAALARAGAALATEASEAAVGVMRDALKRLPAASASRFAMALAEQEVGLGLRLGQPTWLNAGLKRAAALKGLDPTWDLRRRHVVAVGGWLAAQAEGRAPSVEETRRVMGELQSLVDRTDTSTLVGRDYAGALGLSLGALALTVGDVAMAHRSLQWSRRFLQQPLSQLAGAVAGLGRFRDAYGAGLYLDRALRRARSPQLRFTLHKWRALAANRRGDVAQAKTHLSNMLELAKAAGMPEKLHTRSTAPLTLGSLAMIVSTAPLGSPGAIRVETGSVVLMMPSFAHELRQVRRMLKELSATP